MDVTKIRTSGSQTIPTGSIATTVLLNEIEIPATGSAVTPATGSSRIVVNDSGTYLIVFEINSQGTGSLQVYPFITGSNIASPAQYDFDQGASPVSMGKSLLLSLAAGDTVSLVALQNSGVGVDILATLTVAKIGNTA